MAIKVTHDVSPSLLVDASYAAGYGNYAETKRKFDEQLDLQNRSLQQQADLQTQRLVAADQMDLRSQQVGLLKSREQQAVQRESIAAQREGYATDRFGDLASLERTRIAGEYGLQSDRMRGQIDLFQEAGADGRARLAQQGALDQIDARTRGEIEVDQAAAQRQMEEIAQQEANLDRLAQQGNIPQRALDIARSQLEERRVGARPGTLLPPVEDPQAELRQKFESNTFEYEDQFGRKSRWQEKPGGGWESVPGQNLPDAPASQFERDAKQIELNNATAKLRFADQVTAQNARIAAAKQAASIADSIVKNAPANKPISYDDALARAIQIVGPGTITPPEYDSGVSEYTPEQAQIVLDNLERKPQSTWDQEDWKAYGTAKSILAANL